MMMPLRFDPPDLATMLAGGRITGQPTIEMQIPPYAMGFGGMHGGVALSIAAASMAACVPDLVVRSVTGQFLQPIRDTLTVEPRVVRHGHSTASARMAGIGPRGVCLTATATFGSGRSVSLPAWAPPAPVTPHHDSLEAADGLDQLSPALAQVEIRPVDPIEAYSASADSTMTAWVRLSGSDRPTNPTAVIFFLDALPPSYTKCLTVTPTRPIPTVEFTVHFSESLPASPWVLIRSRTIRASEDGWVTEDADAWDVNGVHLAASRQLRLTLGPPDQQRE